MTNGMSGDLAARPVAWMYRHDQLGCVLTSCERWRNSNGWAETPLVPADALDAAQRENERLREGLMRIAQYGFNKTGYGYSCSRMAEALLKGD